MSTTTLDAPVEEIITHEKQEEFFGWLEEHSKHIDCQMRHENAEPGKPWASCSGEVRWRGWSCRSDMLVCENAKSWWEYALAQIADSPCRGCKRPVSECWRYQPV